MSKLTHSAIRCVLAYAMLMSPIIVNAQEAAQQWQTPMLKYVPDDAVFAVIARPRSMLTHQSMEMLPTEVMTAAGKKEFGIDPLDIEAALVVVSPPQAGPRAIGVVLKMRDQSAALTMAQEPPFVRSQNGIIIAATDEAYGQKIISSLEAEMAPLAASMKSANMDVSAALDIATVRPMAMGMLANSPPLPPPFEGLKQAPGLVRRVDLRVRATENPIAAIRFVGNNEADTEKVEALVAESLQAGRAMFMQQLQAQAPNDDPIQVASRQYAERIMNKVFEQIRPVRRGDSLTFAAKGGQANQAAVVGILVALLLPAVNAAREAARRNQTINQVRQISLGLINHESATGQFPARASFDDEGKPLLSWRVHILPFLEQEALYRQFHLDEPWHSDHNRKLIEKMPAVYANPNLTLDAGKTNFLVAVGPGTVFEGKEGRRVREITDGTSKTLLVVEADEDVAVIWTKPEDLNYDPDNPINGLGNLRPAGFVASRCDGSVAFYAKSIDKSVIAAMFSRAGGERVD